jgi:three-Cys-motif partner protein
MDIYDKLPEAAPDGLYTPEIGEWGRQKYLRLWTYASIFSRGMKHRHRHRVYIDLFAGAGKAVIRETGELVLGSPLLALSVPDPFTKYIFCDDDPERVAALEERVARDYPWADCTIIHAPAMEAVPRIVAALPTDGSVLSFCFADPYDLSFDFRIVERLAAGNRRIDFLILLAAQMDGQRNEANYVHAENMKVERLLGDPEWREKWYAAKRSGTGFQRFLMQQYCTAMQAIGYKRPKDSDAYRVKTESGQVPLYYLLFFSKHERGYHFWRQAMKSSVAQRDFMGDLGF